MNLIHQLGKSYQDRVDELIAAMDDIHWLPELPDGYEYNCFPLAGSRFIRISAPFNRFLMKKVKEFLLAQGWEIITEKTENNCGDWYPYYWATKETETGIKYLDIVFFDFNPGSSCKRKYLGTRTVEKEELIYEFSCE